MTEDVISGRTVHHPCAPKDIHVGRKLFGRALAAAVALLAAATAGPAEVLYRCFCIRPEAVVVTARSLLASQPETASP